MEGLWFLAVMGMREAAAAPANRAFLGANGTAEGGGGGGGGLGEGVVGGLAMGGVLMGLVALSSGIALWTAARRHRRGSYDLPHPPGLLPFPRHQQPSPPLQPQPKPQPPQSAQAREETQPETKRVAEDAGEQKVEEPDAGRKEAMDAVLAELRTRLSKSASAEFALFPSPSHSHSHSQPPALNSSAATI